MEPTNLRILPIELHHTISQYLDVKDILNLLGTCKTIRLVNNHDWIWRRFVPETAVQLELLEQKLYPAFQWQDETENDSLSSPCAYQVHYMRMNQVLSNWRRERFVQYSNSTDLDLSSYCCAYSNVYKMKDQVLYKERFLIMERFIGDQQDTCVDVWDINGNPVRVGWFHTRNFGCGPFHVIGSKLVFQNCKNISVLQINLPELELPHVYSFCITESEVQFNSTPAQHETCDGTCRCWSSYKIGQYLMFNKHGDQGGVLHVWDICNASKVGVFELPTPGFSVSVESHDQNKWLLRQKKPSINYSNYYVLDISSESLHNTGFESSAKQTILYQSHIIAFSQSKEPYGEHQKFVVRIVVFDVNLSLTVKSRCIEIPEGNTSFSTRTIVNGCFIILSCEGFLKINALTLETVEIFQCERGIGLASPFFNVFGSPFVVVKREHHLYIWDIAKRKSLTIPLVRRRLFVNDTVTKLVTFENNKINVFHFW